MVTVTKASSTHRKSQLASSQRVLSNIVIGWKFSERACELGFAMSGKEEPWGTSLWTTPSRQLKLFLKVDGKTIAFLTDREASILQLYPRVSCVSAYSPGLGKLGSLCWCTHHVKRLEQFRVSHVVSYMGECMPHIAQPRYPRANICHISNCFARAR